MKKNLDDESVLDYEKQLEILAGKMKWHHIQIYGWLWFQAVVSFVFGISTIETAIDFAISGKEPDGLFKEIANFVGLGVHWENGYILTPNVVLGVLLLALAASFVIAELFLLRSRSVGPKFLLVSYILAIVILVYSIAINPLWINVLGLAAAVALLVCNNKYYNRRTAYFIY